MGTKLSCAFVDVLCDAEDERMFYAIQCSHKTLSEAICYMIIFLNILGGQTCSFMGIL